MKIHIVRHGEPDYSIDSVTPKGAREVQLLADRLSAESISAFYVSPLGRGDRRAYSKKDGAYCRDAGLAA